jgi:Leucine rich repeat variant
VTKDNALPSDLDRLASDARAGVRYAVARQPKTPPATLDRLAGDVSWLVRQEVARNPNTPVATLLRLAEDKNPNVRRAARSHEAFDGVLSWKQAMLWVAVGCLVLAVVVML